MAHPLLAPGPFHADSLRSGDPYELSNGHPVLCLPTGTDGTGPNLRGGIALDTDPGAPAVGVDTGIRLAPGTLRAPDLAVGFGPETGGWSGTVPPLAVEYASRGQDEEELSRKISELLEAGTRWVWVVRLVGERRVEVYERGCSLRTVGGQGVLEAPGVLRNAVPVAALYDRDAAHEVALRNLLQRKGYESLEALREEARHEGLAEGIELGVQQGIELGIEQGVLRGIEQGVLRGVERGVLQGIDVGLAPLLRVLSRRLARPATSEDGVALRRRLHQLGPEAVGDAVLGLPAGELEAWLSE